jgi:hypothetical protein
MAFGLEDLGSLPTLDPSQFNLGGGGGFNLGNLSGFNLGGFNPSLDLSGLPGGGPGGGGGFNFGDILKYASPVKDLITGGLSIDKMIQDRAYQNRLQDYYKQRAAYEKQYNDAQLAYMQQKAEYDQQVLGMYNDFLTQFTGGLEEFQGRIGAIMDQQMAAGLDQLAKANQLQEPAIAVLARGETPPGLEPLINQFKAHARAAAMQEFAGEGIDQSTAAGAITQQIDASAMEAMVKWAQGMLGGGQALAGAGGSFLGQAGQSAMAGLDPIMKEFMALQQSLGGLLGGNVGLAPPAGVGAPPSA